MQLNRTHQTRTIQKPDSLAAMLYYEITPSQHADACKGVYRTPEHKLCVALLEDAIQSFTNPKARNNNDSDVSRSQNAKIRYNEDFQWFVSDSESVCSFVWVCDMLGLNASALRGRILKGGFVLPRRPPNQEAA